MFAELDSDDYLKMQGPLTTTSSKSPSRVQRHRERWTKAEDQLLLSHTLSNSELARQLGRTRKAVTHRRLAKGIYHRPANRRWTEDELRLVGKLPDYKVAALTRM